MKYLIPIILLVASLAGAQTYPPGTELRLTAIPDVGWSFEGWTGDVISVVNPLLITIDDDTSITATFTDDGPPPPTDPTLTITVVGNGTVDVEIVTTDGGVYDVLALHVPAAGEWKLVPNTNADAVFAEWNSYNAWTAWNGMAFDETSGRWWAHGGGHADYGGNEVYLFTFEDLTWTRLTDPSPLTGPDIKPGCPRPESGPAVGHTYDGSIFVPTTGDVLSSGQYIYCGNDTIDPPDGIWVFNNNTWTQVRSAVLPFTVYTAYDTARNRIYIITSEGIWDVDPSNGYGHIVATPPLDYLSVSVAEFNDSTRELLYTIWGVGLSKMTVSLDGTFGPAQLVSTAIAMSSDDLSIAIHDPTDTVVMWGNDGTIIQVDPSDGSSENFTAVGPVGSGSTVASKWVYIEALDVFAGIQDPRVGIWLYKLPTPEVASNFAERCAAAGVVFCDPLDTEGPYDGAGLALTNPDGSSGIPTQTWYDHWRGVAGGAELDTTVGASGTGSLRMTIPSNSWAANGDFATDFTPDNSITFTEGDTFYVQYRWRADCDFMYFDCDPESAGYKTTRRYYQILGGDFSTYAKLSILGTGAVNRSCTDLELVLTHGHDHFVNAYHNCGWYESFEEEIPEPYNYPFDAYNFNFQPNGMYDCQYRIPPEGELVAWEHTGPNCFYLESDEWMTFQMKVEIGTWQPTRIAPPNSRVTIWGAREGQPQQMILDHELYLYGGGTYGRIWLLPYMTSKDDSEVHPVAHVWYDELIVSTEFIADPLVEDIPEPEGIYDDLIAALPPVGEFGLLPGSAINVLTQDGEFPFCADIKCFNSSNAFMAWVGMAFDEANGKWWNPAGGGHADYGGNELYEFDFANNQWARLIDPQPLTGPDLVPGCPAPAVGPPAQHTYDGSLYVPSTNEILVLSGGGYCKSGFVSPNQPIWKYSINTATWTALPLLGPDYPISAYDIARDRIYLISKGNLLSLDPQDGYVVDNQTSITVPGEEWGSGQFDEASRYFYWANGGGIYRVSVALDGAFGAEEQLSTWSTFGPFRAFDIVGEELVFWDGSGTIYGYNTTTEVVTNFSPSTGPIPPTSSGHIYSKWIYIDSVNAFVGMDDPREGIWIYRLPVA